MNRRLVVASHNAHKLREISEILPGWEIVPESPDVEETESTFAGNARLKALAVARLHPGAWVMADDSGLCVDALGGDPGDGDSPANNALLLKNLDGVEDRSAHFTCAIALVSPEGTVTDLEGRCNGRIAMGASGAAGFGYDPLFIPDGYSVTFAELPAEGKNAISHRGRALAKLKEHFAAISAGV